MIKLWRLTTGEDIIGNRADETEEGYTLIKKPFVLILSLYPSQSHPALSRA